MYISKSLWINRQKLKLGVSAFGYYGKKIGSIKRIVHDGDTVSTRLIHNLGVRFLGIDTPEISFQFPETNIFVSLSNKKWDNFFKSGKWKENFDIGQDLYHYLSNIIGNGKNVANNQFEIAKEAEKSLVKIITSDLKKSKRGEKSFTFFMAFANEFLDWYGRLLCYLNSSTDNYRSQKHKDEIKKFSYNERQLAAGLAVPYFIWPNIQPFLSIDAFSKKNVIPKNFWILIKSSTKLHQARKFVSDARTNSVGIFNSSNLLKLLPFELRMIARKQKPNRYVIDLRDEGSNVLLTPEEYIKIPHSEDRLFIPYEYVPIFRVFGWVIRSS